MTKKYTIFIRIMTGILGLAGIAAIIFKSLKMEEFSLELQFIAGAFGCLVFLYYAATGTNPLDTKKKEEMEE